MRLPDGLYNFYYHDVSDDPLVPASFRTSPARFRDEIQFISRHFEILPFKEAVAEQRRHLRAGTDWPRPMATITFDDGYRGVLTAAAPVLEEFRAPATVFLNGGYLSGRYICPVVLANYGDLHWPRRRIEQAFDRIASGQTLRNFVRNTLDRALFERVNALFAPVVARTDLYLAADDLARLPAGLVDFGNHTYHHLRLSRLSRSEQREEVASNDTVLRGTRGYDPLICIPFGDGGSFNDDTRAVVRELGDGYLIQATGCVRHRGENGLTVIERMGLSDNKPPIRRLVTRRLRGQPDRPALTRRLRSLALGMRALRLRLSGG